MSNVIQFLESMGSNAALGRFSSMRYEATVASLRVGADQRQALLNRDSDALGRLLGGRQKMQCLIYQPGVFLTR